MATATRARAKGKSERIEARATADEAAVIARAAELSNSMVSSFVIGAAVAWIAGDGASGAIPWLITAFLDAVLGFVLGSVLIPVVSLLLKPISVLFPEK